MSECIIENGLMPGWPHAYPAVRDRLDALDDAGLVVHGRGLPRLKTYLAASKGIAATDLIAGLTLGELPMHFPEIDEAAADCRFSNCAHLEEPSCAVQAAEMRGDISPSRASSYRAIFDELEV